MVNTFMGQPITAQQMSDLMRQHPEYFHMHQTAPLPGRATLNTTANLDRSPWTIPPEARSRNIILWSRNDAKTSRHPRARTNLIHSSKVKHNVLNNFNTLHEEYPRRSYLRPIGGMHRPNDPVELTTFVHDTVFVFERGHQGTQHLYIMGQPALTLMSVYLPYHPSGDVLEYHLAEIRSTSTPRSEKYKRLFLRHLGFDCTLYRGKLSILIPGMDRLIIENGKGYRFALPTSIPTDPFDRGYMVSTTMATMATNSASRIGTILLK